MTDSHISMRQRAARLSECRPSRRAALAAFAAAMFCAGAGCGSSGVANGTALNPGYATIYGIAPIKPGTQLGLLDVDLLNRSPMPITLASVTGLGRGLGTAIHVVEVKIAPADSGNRSTPGGAYQTDPPVFWSSSTRTCSTQELRPLRGFRIAPGGLARVWIVVQAAHPGQFAVTGHVVRYTQGGVLYRQAIPTGYKGLVSRTAPFIPLYWAQARCLTRTKARLLHGQSTHLPRSPASGSQ